ncbi:MAG: minor capsid protein [Fibrobacter sp.]|nr:minor capsid protein [Fibrobacter sp.]MBR6449709.1 minor capsid protein [Fibrobacter sp.]
MTFAEFIQNLRTLKLKKKGQRPKMNPNKFYPSQAELQTQEVMREELNNYADKLEKAASTGEVAKVYAVPGAVPDGFREVVEGLAEKVSEFQMRSFASFSELTVGERYFPSQENKEQILNTWTENFVNQCKSTNEEMRKKVAGVVSDGVLEGRNLRDITKEVKQTCTDFTDNKAELIATTEVGKLNSAISKDQAKSAGIEYYEWSAAMDGRTRDSHAVMDGKICKWGDDDGYYKWVIDEKTGKKKLKRFPRPKEAYKGAPGTDFRCRCTALPYVPEFEDDYEDRKNGEVEIQGAIQRPATYNKVLFLSEKQIKEKLPASINRSRELENKIFGKRIPRPKYIQLDVDGGILIDEKKYEAYQKSLKKPRKRGDEVDKFNRETEMAQIMKRIGFSTILIKERNIPNVPNPDAILDGKIAEFKQVDGSVKRIDEHIKHASHQGGKTVCVNVKSEMEFNDMVETVRHRLGTNPKKLTVYVYFKDKLYKFE